MTAPADARPFDRRNQDLFQRRPFTQLVWGASIFGAFIVASILSTVFAPRPLAVIFTIIAIVGAAMIFDAAWTFSRQTKLLDALIDKSWDPEPTHALAALRGQDRRRRDEVLERLRKGEAVVPPTT